MSPSPPSVSWIIMMLLPLSFRFGREYQLVPSYFHHTVPMGTGPGKVTVTVTVSPGVRQQMSNENIPCGKVTPAGAPGAGAIAVNPTTFPLLIENNAVPPVIGATVFLTQGSKRTLADTASPLPGPFPLGPSSAPHQL